MASTQRHHGETVSCFLCHHHQISSFLSPLSMVKRLVSTRSVSPQKKKSRTDPSQPTLASFLQGSSSTVHVKDIIHLDLSDEETTTPTLTPTPVTAMATTATATATAMATATATTTTTTTATTASRVIYASSDTTTDVEAPFDSLTIDPLVYGIPTTAWPKGKQAPYAFLSHALAGLSETKSRISILNILTNCLRTIGYLDPAALLPSLYLFSNSLSPPYSSIELGLGPSIISKAIQQISGLSSTALKRLYVTTGDPGDVAFNVGPLLLLLPHGRLLLYI